MSRLQFATDRIVAARTYTTWLLDHTDPADWFRFPPGGVSHIGWQVGHLAYAEFRLAVERVRGPRPEDASLLPEEFIRRFGPSSAPEKDPARCPAPADVRAVFDRIHAEALRTLEHLDEAVLDRPVTRPHPRFNTVFGGLLWCAQHEAVHAGQIGLLRRELGQPPLW
jgi:hypothetical protein